MIRQKKKLKFFFFFKVMTFLKNFVDFWPQKKSEKKLKKFSETNFVWKIWCYWIELSKKKSDFRLNFFKKSSRNLWSQIWPIKISRYRRPSDFKIFTFFFLQFFCKFFFIFRFLIQKQIVLIFETWKNFNFSPFFLTKTKKRVPHTLGVSPIFF